MPEQQDCANAKVAMELGRQVLAIRAALDNPAAPDAMQAIVELGTDWRGYVMVRGWLAEQLRADTSIAAASQGDPPARIAARIEFLERAIRAIDLE